ncbi:MAG: response regulator [SAR324 cluster bacterium]|nr:response regulator [SAR324 cluster bacterium]
MVKVLVIDDNPQNLQQLKEILNELGYSSGILSMPEFLFDRLDVEMFDLILMDVNMPKVDGITLLKELKQQPDYADIPVVMLTGDPNDEILAQCFENGASDFIKKPVSRLVLKARLRTIFQAKKRTDDLELRVSERTDELENANLQMQITCSELERLNNTFQLFVPKQFLHRILLQKTIDAQEFEEEQLTILFSDIRSYTEIAEQMTSKESFQFLNTFYSLVEPIISKHQGFVDKFIGDAVMALYDQEQSADHAVRSAIEMRAEMRAYNDVSEQKNLPPINIGIGINTGRVVFGALGSENRMSSTVVGDAVNLASRLEALTKIYNTPILISHNTHAAIDPNQYLIREIDTIQVRGRSERVIVYEVFDSDPTRLKELKLKTKGLMLQGIVLYKSQFFAEALAVFEECFQLFPHDIINIEYLKRCRYFVKFPPVQSPFWTGVVASTEMLINQSLRRRSRRYLFETEIAILISSSVQGIYGEAKDISQGGMRICLESPLMTKEIVIAQISFKGTDLAPFFEQDHYSVVCCVMWKREMVLETKKTIWNTGLEFVTVPSILDDNLPKAIQQLKSV